MSGMTDRCTDKAYIGDSVYAGRDGTDIVLWLDNGDGPFGEIVLDPDTAYSLRKYMEKVE